MRKYAIIGSVVIMMCTVMTFQVRADAPEGQEGQVPATILSDFGLAGLQPVSDETGMQVRGMAMVWGSPSTGRFITDVAAAAFEHTPAGKSMPGQVRHDLLNHTVLLMYHPGGLKIMSK